MEKQNGSMSAEEFEKTAEGAFMVAVGAKRFAVIEELELTIFHLNQFFREIGKNGQDVSFERLVKRMEDAREATSRVSNMLGDLLAERVL